MNRSFHSTGTSISHLRPNPVSGTTPDNPMRFCDKDIVAARPNLAFLPFGAGPHRCFGASMGYLQAQFLLAQLPQRFRIQTPPGLALEHDPRPPWPWEPFTRSPNGGSPRSTTGRG